MNTGVGSHFLLQGVFPTQDWSWVSHTAGRFFTIWTTREAGPDRRRQTISYIRWHRSWWAGAQRTVLKKMRFYREELSGGKARERALWPKSHTGQGAKSRFDPALSDSQKSSSWGPVATSCWLTKGPVLLLSDMEQLICLFLLIWKKKWSLAKMGKISYIANGFLCTQDSLFLQHCELGIVITPILQMRKLRHAEKNWLS